MRRACNEAVTTSFLSITSALFFTPNAPEGPIQWRLGVVGRLTRILESTCQLSTVNYRLSAVLPSLCFQQLPTIKFSNHFVLIRIRIAGGGYRGLPVVSFKSYFNWLLWRSVSGSGAC